MSSEGGRLIDGKEIAGEVRSEVAERVASLREEGTTPGLAVFLLGDDPASKSYVRMKTRDCEEVGIDTRDFFLPADTPQEELEGRIDEMNEDSSVHGVLVQLPLPDHVDERAITERIDPAKDVDGFHPVNVGRLAKGEEDAFRPATPAGIQEMLSRVGYDPAGERAVIVGRSNLVGRPMASLLLRKAAGGNATVTVAHSRTRDLGAVTREADLLIVAVGRPGTVDADMVREGAVVVDVGVNRVDDPDSEKGYRLVGDVAFDEVRERASRITPVPGGVGPMTRAMLLDNTVRAARRNAADGSRAEDRG